MPLLPFHDWDIQPNTKVAPMGRIWLILFLRARYPQKHAYILGLACRPNNLATVVWP